MRYIRVIRIISPLHPYTPIHLVISKTFVQVYLYSLGLIRLIGVISVPYSIYRGAFYP